MPSNKKIAGAFSGYLSGENMKVFNYTFTELTKYQRDEKSQVNCLGRLLEHLCDAFAYQAVFAFMVGSDEIELLYQKTPTELSKGIYRKLKDHCLNHNYMGGEVVDRLTKDKALELSGAFEDGLLIQNRTFPVITSSVSHVAVYFFGCQKQIGLEFRKEWLGALVTLWSDVFAAKLQQFKHHVSECKTHFVPSLFSKASKIQPWLRCSEVITLCEAALGHADNKNEAVRKELEERIVVFGAEWHCCPDRRPCDEARAFRMAKYGPLNWYLWRLCSKDRGGQYLKEALEFTSREVRMKLRGYLCKTPLNAFLETYFLLHLDKNSKKVLSTIANSGPDNYKSRKDLFGRFMAERLSDAPIHTESVESMIWTICEYAYSVLKVDRRLHLGSHLRHTARGESSLHMMKEFYRDHFFHTIEVCQLGHILANARPSAKTRKNQRFLENSTCSLTSPMKKWHIASLLHDSGYGVDVCNSTKEWLKFYSQYTFHLLGKRIDSVMEGHGDGKNETSRKNFEDFYKKNGFNEKFDAPFRDHGLMAAYHVHTLCEDSMKRNKRNSIKGIKEPIEAIAKHNCQNIEVDYSREPLSALLILCDTLQAWRRPQFPHFSQGPAWMMSLLSSKGQTSGPPQTTGANLLTNLEFAGPRKDSPQFDQYLLLRLVFDQAVNRDSFVFNIWLDALCNLQRVDFTKLPFNILVQIQTPTYRPPGTTTGITQMNRLRDAAADTHMTYLENFLEHTRNPQKVIPEVRKKMGDSFKVKYPISYHVKSDSDGPQYELLSFSLKKMDGNRRFMTNSLSRFRKDLKGWKRFSEDRLLVGDYSPWQHSIW